MSVTHQIKETWTDGSTSLSATIKQTGNVESNLDVTVPGGGFLQAAIAITKSTLQSFYLLSSQACSVFVNGADAIQSLTPGGTIGGTDSFKITFGGQTTAAIPFNSTAASVQSALQAISSIGAGNVAVTGAPGGPWTVEFIGALANAAQSTMTSGSIVTSGSATLTVASVQAGSAAAQTIALQAGIPVPWHKDSTFANPLTASVTRLSITAPAGPTVALSCRSIYN